MVPGIATAVAGHAALPVTVTSLEGSAILSSIVALLAVVSSTSITV